MARCSPGDSVVCHIKDGSIVNIYDEKWDDTRVFDIVSLYEEGYMVYIPISVIIKESISLTEANYKKFNASKKFVDSTVCYITDYRVISVHRKLDGLCCIKCGCFCSMAEPNQPDNKSLICWGCRKYPFYR